MNQFFYIALFSTLNLAGFIYFYYELQIHRAIAHSFKDCIESQSNLNKIVFDRMNAITDAIVEGSPRVKVPVHPTVKKMKRAVKQ